MHHPILHSPIALVPSAPGLLSGGASGHRHHHHHHPPPPPFVILRYFLIIVECEIDPDCRTDQICHNNKCIDPCLVENPCAINAICQGQNHASRCTCPAGLVGNPYVNCETVECYINSDCDSSKACIQNECFDPCLLDNVCAPTAICRYVYFQYFFFNIGIAIPN